MSDSTHRPVLLAYEVTSRDDWELSEDKVPESRPHDRRSELIHDLLDHWVRRTGLDAEVARNLAVRWDREHPNVGIDPDVCLIVPAPPERSEIESLLTWQRGHSPPRLAFEVVSSRADKDYVSAPAKYAVNGTFELVVFDPMMRARPPGGAMRLQIFRRARDQFVRVSAGEGPFYVETLGAWVFAVDEGRRLRIADDREGTRWWRTAEEEAKEVAEAARGDAEAARGDAEAARTEAEAAREEARAARARIAELEEKLRG